jgi:hypothetical protein
MALPHPTNWPIIPPSTHQPPRIVPYAIQFTGRWPARSIKWETATRHVRRGGDSFEERM